MRSLALQQDWLESDFYDVLGVTDKATDSEITKAYRKLARENHPDTNPGDDAAEERFKAISRAYEVVGDTAQRTEYDEVRRYGSQPSSGPFGRGHANADFGGFGSDPRLNDFVDLSDLLNGSGQFGGFRQGPRPGADIQTRLSLDFDDAVRGLETTLTLSTGGRSSHDVKVRIPAGVNTGQTIRVAGKGGDGESGAPNGDLFIELDVGEHEVFGRKGHNLTLTLPVTYAEAALGADIRVPTFDGDPVTVRVPEGTPGGRTLRVKGKGVARAGGVGDLLVTIEIAVPKKLNRAERKAVKALRDALTDQPSPRDHLFATDNPESPLAGTH